MWAMKRSGDSTHPCQSPTPTVNGRDLTLTTRTQTSEQEYRVFHNCWNKAATSKTFIDDLIHFSFPDCHREI